MHLVKRFALVLVGCMALKVFVNCDPVILVEIEPNDTPEAAPNLSYEFAEGEITPAGDKDYWKIRLQNGCTYTFTLSKLTDDLQLMLYVFPNTVENWNSPISTQAYDASRTTNETFTITATDNSWILRQVMKPAGIGCSGNGIDTLGAQPTVGSFMH